MNRQPSELNCCSSPDFLTVDEAAALLRINRKTLYDAIQRKQVPGVVRVGKAIRIARPVFEHWALGGASPEGRRRPPEMIKSNSGQGVPVSHGEGHGS